MLISGQNLKKNVSIGINKSRLKKKDTIETVKKTPQKPAYSTMKTNTVKLNQTALRHKIPSTPEKPSLSGLSTTTKNPVPKPEKEIAAPVFKRRHTVYVNPTALLLIKPRFTGSINKKV